jgi:hypothetical protein
MSAAAADDPPVPAKYGVAPGIEIGLNGSSFIVRQNGLRAIESPARPRLDDDRVGGVLAAVAAASGQR